MTQNKIEMKIMCEFLKGSCPFEQTSVCGDRQAYAPNLAPRGLKKALFFGKVANIVAETKNGKISTLLLVQNIYMIPLLKPLNDINISCLVTAYSGENAKNCFHKNSQKCHQFWATLPKDKFTRDFKKLPKMQNVAQSCRTTSIKHILARIQHRH
jgi:hypothetical protein